MFWRGKKGAPVGEVQVSPTGDGFAVSVVTPNRTQMITDLIAASEEAMVASMLASPVAETVHRAVIIKACKQAMAPAVALLESLTDTQLALSWAMNVSQGLQRPLGAQMEQAMLQAVETMTAILDENNPSKILGIDEV